VDNAHRAKLEAVVELTVANRDCHERLEHTTKSWLACASNKKPPVKEATAKNYVQKQAAIEFGHFDLVNINSKLTKTNKALTDLIILNNSTISQLEKRILGLQDDVATVTTTASGRATSIIDLTTANADLTTTLDTLKASSATDLLNATRSFEDYQEEVGLGFAGLLSNQSTTLANLTSYYHGLFTQARDDHLTATEQMRKDHDASLRLAQSTCKDALSTLTATHDSELAAMVTTHAEETRRLQESRDSYERDAIYVRNLTEQSAVILQQRLQHNAKVCVNKTRIARASLQTCLDKNHTSRRRRCPPVTIHAGLFDITTVAPIDPAPVDPVPPVSSTTSPISTLLTKMTTVSSTKSIIYTRPPTAPPMVTTEEADLLVAALLDDAQDEDSGSGDTSISPLALSTSDELESPAPSRHIRSSSCATDSDAEITVMAGARRCIEWNSFITALIVCLSTFLGISIFCLFRNIYRLQVYRKRLLDALAS
jgi:hypothetical protein